jgi:parallel beta-helix repeat protein
LLIKPISITGRLLVSRILVRIMLMFFLVTMLLTSSLRQAQSAAPPAFSAWAFVKPTIDGVLSLDEWDDAAVEAFTLSTPERHDCVLYVKNDEQNLYVALVIKGEEFNPFPPEGGPCDYVSIAFDNDHDGIRWEAGDDCLFLRGDGGYVYDGFFRTGGGWVPDETYGGSNDIVGAVSHTNPVGIGDYVFECLHPLDTADNAHDFSLSFGGTVGFRLNYCDGASFGGYVSFWPETACAKIVVAKPVIMVPDDYSTIQEAINAAYDGDSIFVRAGTYCENVVVNKTVSLCGESRATTIIDGNETGDCVHVTAGGVKICDFTIRNGGARPGTAYSSVRLSSSGNSIINNDLLDSWCGVWIEHDCDYNLFAGNNMSGNLNGLAGELWHNSKVIGNNIVDNLLGIWMGPYSVNNIVSFNNISRHWSEGISMWQSSYNTFEGNNITDNNRCSWATSITIGFQVGFSAGNKFFHNTIANNGQQVSLEGQEQEPVVWDDGYPSGGNYWSDYVGTDADGDGIGDVPHAIDVGSQDNYPLMKPWTPPDFAVTNITASKTIVGQGYTQTINVAVTNQGSKIEGYNLTVYANTTVIETTYFTLPGGNSTILAFAWNTASFGKGNYSIRAVANPLPEEVDTLDNTFTDGIVYVGIPGDVDGNHIVNMLDIYCISDCFGARRGHEPNYAPDCDVEDNGIINMLDLYTAATHFGQTDP